MNSQIPTRQYSLSLQILDILIEKIRNGEYPAESFLPPETQLAEEYKVSRATIRNAFDHLVTMGLITRRQGIGTSVRRISNISDQLNHFIEFFELIRENGHQPGFEQISAELIEPRPDLAQNLSLDTGLRVLRVHKVFLADGDPIIFCINHIPQCVFQDVYTPEEAIQPSLTEPFLISLKTNAINPLVIMCPPSERISFVNVLTPALSTRWILSLQFLSLIILASITKIAPSPIHRVPPC
jgi:DNA-binding GntR family transcriptional regulator